MNKNKKDEAGEFIKEKMREFSEDDIEIIREKMPEKIAQFEKGKKDAHFINRLLKRAKLFYDLLLDKEFKTSWKIYAATGASLLYFINPIDLIPDVILGLGWLDDFYVFGWVLKTFNDEIERYIEFKGLDRTDYY